MSTVIRFSGDSGDGMQMVGNPFAESMAFNGYSTFTFPDYFPNRQKAIKSIKILPLFLVDDSLIIE